MFNLEQSITEWRQQMLAAGIKTPVPLEELEGHLREEIEGQIKLGMSEQQAFEATALQIGPGQELQTEFAKDCGWRDLLQGNMSKRAKLLLLCWVAFCLMAFPSVYEGHAHSSTTWFARALFIILLAIIAIAAYMAGILWSFFLFRSTKQVRRVILVITGYSNLVFLIPMIILRKSLFHEMLFVPVYFNLFTSVLLSSPRPAEPKKATS